MTAMTRKLCLDTQLSCTTACIGQVVSRSNPNKAHFALAALEKRCKEEGKNLTLITQVRPATVRKVMHTFATSAKPSKCTPGVCSRRT